MKIALQIYSVRDSISDAESLMNALKKVKEIGYEGVEFAGCFGADAIELREYLKELGLEAVGCHESLRNIDTGNIDEMLHFYHQVGVENFVCSYAPASTKEELEHLCAQMEKVKAKAENLGMKTGYHNHSHEFKAIGGIRPIDKIASCCNLELDTYCSFIGGEDISSFLRQRKAQIGLLHLNYGSADGKPCAIGEGVADIQAVLDAAKEIGSQWIIVENDNPTPDGFSDVRRSLDALKTRYAL